MITVAVITSIAGLVTSIASLVRAFKGDNDHAENAAAIAQHETRLSALEKS